MCCVNRRFSAPFFSLSLSLAPSFDLLSASDLILTSASGAIGQTTGSGNKTPHGKWREIDPASGSAWLVFSFPLFLGGRFVARPGNVLQVALGSSAEQLGMPLQKRVGFIESGTIKDISLPPRTFLGLQPINVRPSDRLFSQYWTTKNLCRLSGRQWRRAGD